MRARTSEAEPIFDTVVFTLHPAFPNTFHLCADKIIHRHTWPQNAGVQIWFQMNRKANRQTAGDRLLIILHVVLAEHHDGSEGAERDHDTKF